MAHHIVKKAGDMVFSTPVWFDGYSEGYTADYSISEAAGSVHTGFRVSRLEPGGRVGSHLHSFEESFFVIEGDLVVDTPDGSVAATAGDYGLIPTATPHALRNVSDGVVTFAEVMVPVPRERFDFDTYRVGPVPQSDPIVIDPRDPRTRNYGHISPENMDPDNQTQDKLAQSASMRTALLVYSGISVKMMIDSDLGSDQHTMFMVQYVPGGFAGPHDHPLEEAYLFLEGKALGVFDGQEYVLEAGDIAWAGVGCVHEFRNLSEDGVVRWLETAAPQPPGRHSYRFRRDWIYLENALALEMGPGGKDSNE